MKKTYKIPTLTIVELDDEFNMLEESQNIDGIPTDPKKDDDDSRQSKGNYSVWDHEW